MAQAAILPPPMLHDKGQFRCLASSGTEVPGDPATLPVGKTSFFRYAEWTSDGTSIISLSGDNVIRTWIIPPNLLQDRATPLSVQAYSTIPHNYLPSSSVPPACPVTTIAQYPLFDLQNTATTVVLSSVRNMPICLNSALTSDLVATYPLVNPTTEAFIAPNSLLFIDSGARFLAGSDSLISTFDISRPGSEPLASIRTGPKRNSFEFYSPGTTMRGLVSALAEDPASKLLAAGTFSRSVGLYDSSGQGECVGVFSVTDTEADKSIGGSGVTQLLGSPCGKYLHIAERGSDGVITYDIRNTGQMLGWLHGRNATTNQRMNVDIVQAKDGSGYEVWAGAVDGKVKVWRDPHLVEGKSSPVNEVQVHEDSVSCVSIHQSGTVLATAAGHRHFDVTGASRTDNTLRLWAL